MRRSKKIIRPLSVLKPEDSVAVLLPATAEFVGFARQQRGEVHLLGANALHLFTDDRLDAALNLQAERQPGEDTWALAANVAGTHEKTVTRHLRIGGIFAKGSDKQLGESSGHVNILAATFDAGFYAFEQSKAASIPDISAPVDSDPNGVHWHRSDRLRP